MISKNKFLLLHNLLNNYVLISYNQQIWISLKYLNNSNNF